MAGDGSYLPAERHASHRAHQQLGLCAAGELIARDCEHAALGPCADAAVTHHVRHDGAVPKRGAPSLHGHAKLRVRAQHAHLPLEHHRQHSAARALAA